MADDHSLTARIDAAVNLVVRIASGEVDARGEISEHGDGVDALVEGLNMLAEELRAETAARQHAEALLADERDAYEEAPALFCSVGLPDLKVIKCNRTLARTLGKPKAELVGSSVLALCQPEGREALERLLRELKPGAPTIGPELTLEAGERALIVAASATRVRDDVAGDRARVIFQDITARVRLQSEHAQLQERYRQAQKLEAIGRLAGGVAHDFNNALTVISLSAQFALQQQSDASGLRRSIEQITVAAKHAAELTRQLLAFSRKQILHPVVVDLDGLIERMHPMLARIIGEDVVLRTIPSGQFARIRADQGQLEQVVVNLVINARDAMPDGGEILIETARVLLDEDYCARHADVTPGTYAMLAVSDTGCGMSPATREKIFEPFFSTKALGQGTGLGLATVFGIVKQSGGRIEVYSELDKGSSFKVYFPFVDATASPVTAPPRAQPIGGRETVLLVEDDALVRQVAVDSLVRLGYRVLVAGSGPEAIALADAHVGEIDLVLTDVVMPGMNGRELVTRLATKRPGLKVLYASGFTENVIAHHGVLKPGVQFVAKPYSFEFLAERIRAALEA